MSLKNMEHSDNVEQESSSIPTSLNRRQLLKLLAAAGGGVAASTLLPAEWSRPVVEVGVLPVHAQISDPQNLATIETCHASNVQGGSEITPTDTIETWAEISGPVIDGIAMRRTVILHQEGHPQDEDPIVYTGYTDSTGRFEGPTFDLAAEYDPNIEPSTGNEIRITVRWEFVYSYEGTGTCLREIVVAEE